MLGGLVALGAALPAAGLAIVPSFVRKRTRAVDLGPISAFREGEFTAVTFLADPAAGEISRRAAYVRNNGLLGTEPSFTIMSSRCTHVGCPCHGSQFDTEGNRIAGPAPRALDRYEFSIRDGRLYLGKQYSVSRVDGAGSDARIHGYALQGAGQPASGVESWLYPLDPS
jgi:hypothetical protein